MAQEIKKYFSFSQNVKEEWSGNKQIQTQPEPLSSKKKTVS